MQHTTNPRVVFLFLFLKSPLLTEQSKYRVFSHYVICSQTLNPFFAIFEGWFTNIHKVNKQIWTWDYSQKRFLFGISELSMHYDNDFFSSKYMHTKKAMSSSSPELP